MAQHLKRDLFYFRFISWRKQHHQACMMGRQTEQLELLPPGEQVRGLHQAGGSAGLGETTEGLFPRKLSAVYSRTQSIFWKGTKSCISEVKAKEQNSFSLQSHLIYGHNHYKIFFFHYKILNGYLYARGHNKNQK